jgi:hypothetical protein
MGKVLFEAFLRNPLSPLNTENTLFIPYRKPSDRNVLFPGNFVGMSQITAGSNAESGNSQASLWGCGKSLLSQMLNLAIPWQLHGHGANHCWVKCWIWQFPGNCVGMGQITAESNDESGNSQASLWGCGKSLLSQMLNLAIPWQLCGHGANHCWVKCWIWQFPGNCVGMGQITADSIAESGTLLSTYQTQHFIWNWVAMAIVRLSIWLRINILSIHVIALFVNLSLICHLLYQMPI